MWFTFLRNGSTARDRRSRYLLGGLKLLVAMVVAAGLVAGKCNNNCSQNCVVRFCETVSSVRVELLNNGAPITDLAPGSTMHLYVGDALGNTDFLIDGLLTFNGTNTASVNLDTPMPKSHLVDSTGTVRNPPDASFSAFDDKLCTTIQCAPGKVFRYRVLQPPAFDFDFAACQIVLKFNTKRMCAVCP